MLVVVIAPVGTVSTQLRRGLVRCRCHVDVASGVSATSSSSSGATSMVIAQRRRCPRRSPRGWTRKWPGSAAAITVDMSWRSSVANAAATTARFARWGRRRGGPFVGHRVFRDGSVGGGPAVLAVGRVAAIGLGVREVHRVAATVRCHVVVALDLFDRPLVYILQHFSAFLVMLFFSVKTSRRRRSLTDRSIDLSSLNVSVIV